MILALECDESTSILCKPPEVNHVFEAPTIFRIG